MFEDTKTIQLIKPVVLGKEENAVTYDHLDLREPIASELSKARNAANNVDVVINLVTAVCKVPRAVAERLCQRDLKACDDFFDSFSTGGAPEDGQS
jgi:hypothetical protein